MLTLARLVWKKHLNWKAFAIPPLYRKCPSAELALPESVIVIYSLLLQIIVYYYNLLFIIINYCLLL